MGLLDLSDADLKGFDAIDGGRYPAEIVAVEGVETQGGENAKLPKGTPGFNVQFKITAPEEVENRRVFRRFFFPPPKGADGKAYPKDKAAKMKGMIVRFLETAGYDRDQITSGNFDLDYEDLIGRELVVQVSKREYPKGQDPPEFVNDVTGFKPAGTPTAVAGAGLL